MSIEHGICLIDNVMGTRSIINSGADVINSLKQMREVLQKIKLMLAKLIKLENEM